MLRNFLWSLDNQTFQEGFIEDEGYNMPTNTSLVRRLSWYNDGKNSQGFNYLYATGTDGLLHEYTFKLASNNWQHTNIFPNSNGYSGCTILADSSKNLTTMHLINQDGQMEFWWRNLTVDSVAATPWNKGVESGTEWPVTIYENSTLAMSQNGIQLVFQDPTGELYDVGWRGYRDSQQWNAPVDSGLKAMLGTSVAATDGGNIFPGLNIKASIFVQLNGNDITLLLRNNSALYPYQTVHV